MGAPFMPWQDQVAGVALEADPATGLLLHQLVVVTVPRQQGKSVLLRVRATLECCRRARAVVASTAQTRNDARDRWEEGLAALEASALAPLLGTARRSNGSERMRWRNGSVWRVFAPVEDGAHGLSLDLGIVDEAWSLEERVIQALQPAMAARPDPQLWIVSTAGTDSSSMLRRYVELGRATVDLDRPPMVYAEWSAAEGADPLDPETWAGAMPALGHTVTVDKVAQAAATTPTGEFERAYLNRWTRTFDRAIPAVWWDACADPAGELPEGAPLAFALDVTVDRSAGAIVAAAARPDGRVGLELVDHRPGVEWMVPRALELVDRWSPFAIRADSVGPAGNLAADLVYRGVPVEATTTAGYAEACAAFYDALAQGGLAHRVQPGLEEAVAVAIRRPLGERWAWGRRQSVGDISPLVAATLAYDACRLGAAPAIY